MESMRLKILLPFGIFMEKQDIKRIVLETRQGAFGLLPNRLDCTGALAPGILNSYPKRSLPAAAGFANPSNNLNFTPFLL